MSLRKGRRDADDDDESFGYSELIDYMVVRIVFSVERIGID